jgi:hypothetical protein
MREVHRTLAELRRNDTVVAESSVRSRTLFASRLRFVSTWNCTVGRRHWSAVCQRCAMLALGPRPLAITAGGTQTWRYLRGKPAGELKTSDVVLVLCPAHSTTAQITRLVNSLRLTGSRASVVLVVGGATPGSDGGIGKGTDALAEIGPTFQPDAALFELDPLATLFAVAAGFLVDTAVRIKHVLQCSPTTTFTTDPFAAEGGLVKGLAAFVTSIPPFLLTMSPPSKVLVRTIFGTCSNAEAVATPGWIGPAAVDPHIAAGSPTVLAACLAATIQLHHRAHAGNSPRQCSIGQAYSRVIWSGKAAVTEPVTVFTATESPVNRRFEDGPESIYTFVGSTQ